VSRIKESPRLVRGAEATGRSVQRSIDHLTAELGRGNLNPGIGTRAIGRGLSEARARDGARVYFRQAPDGTIEILGKSTKHNQAEVIREVLRIFGQ
jgi:putative component of toxin-antitoxin plasmid stabilization module